MVPHLEKMVFRQALFFIPAAILLLGVSSHAKLGVGVAAAAGSRFTVGGRVSCSWKNPLIPHPSIRFSMTPLSTKILFKKGSNSYVQLHEHSMLFGFGILEQLRLTEKIGVEGEYTAGILEGWYRGTKRDFSTAFVPVLAAGPVFFLNEHFHTVLRGQWYQRDGDHYIFGSLIMEVVF